MDQSLTSASFSGQNNQFFFFFLLFCNCIRSGLYDYNAKHIVSQRCSKFNVTSAFEITASRVEECKMIQSGKGTVNKLIADSFDIFMPLIFIIHPSYLSYVFVVVFFLIYGL